MTADLSALAGVIREAAIRWQKLKLGSMAACNDNPGDCDAYIAAAVIAHLENDAVVERAFRAFTLEIFRQNGESPPDLDKQIRETSPADLRKVEATMRAALRAAGGGGGG